MDRESSRYGVRITVEATPDPVPLPSLLIAVRDSDVDRFQYTKETFDLCISAESVLVKEKSNL